MSKIIKSEARLCLLMAPANCTHRIFVPLSTEEPYTMRDHRSGTFTFVVCGREPSTSKSLDCPYCKRIHLTVNETFFNFFSGNFDVRQELEGD